VIERVRMDASSSALARLEDRCVITFDRRLLTLLCCEAGQIGDCRPIASDVCLLR